MKFALTYVYDPERATPGGMEEIQEWLDLDEEIREAGAHVYADGLQPTSEAHTVSLRDGAVTVAAGPATGPDAVAGFWVVDVPSVDEALAYARRVPTARYGKVEVRPVVEWEG